MIKHGCPSFTFKRLVCHPKERDTSRTLTVRVKYVHEHLYYKNRGTVFILLMRQNLMPQTLGHMGDHLLENGQCLEEELLRCQ